jgi:hypothetical protein
MGQTVQGINQKLGIYNPLGDLGGSDAKQVGAANLMTPEQMKFLNSLITGLGPQAQQAFSGLLQGYDEDIFQKGVVDPSMRTYQQQILPAIEQRFTDANAGSSSALNQALSTSAGDLTNILAGQRIGLQQSMGNQQLGALGQIMSLLGQRSFDPIVQGPKAGLLKDIVGAGASIGSAALMSSREVKENIVDYDKGLETVRNLKVKQYDYTVPVEGRQKERIGLIAEEVPREISAELNGIKAVDLYGIVSLLINSVKQLDANVKALEEKCLLLSKA